MPYVNFFGPDFIPDRSHVFFVSAPNPFEGEQPSWCAVGRRLWRSTAQPAALLRLSHSLRLYTY